MDDRDQERITGAHEAMRNHARQFQCNLTVVETPPSYKQPSMHLRSPVCVGDAASAIIHSRVRPSLPVAQAGGRLKSHQDIDRYDPVVMLWQWAR